MSRLGYLAQGLRFAAYVRCSDLMACGCGRPGRRRRDLMILGAPSLRGAGGAHEWQPAGGTAAVADAHMAILSRGVAEIFKNIDAHRAGTPSRVALVLNLANEL